MSGNIQTLYTTIAGVKQDFKVNWKEDAKLDWKVTWAVTGSGSGSGSGGTPSTPVPVNTVLPVISGNLASPAVLTATTGTWTNNPTSYAYQWVDSYNGPIAGATSSTYTTTMTDVGYSITCHVIAINAGGNSAPATSNSLGPIA